MCEVSEGVLRGYTTQTKLYALLQKKQQEYPKEFITDFTPWTVSGIFNMSYINKHEDIKVTFVDPIFWITTPRICSPRQLEGTRLETIDKKSQILVSSFQSNGMLERNYVRGLRSVKTG